MKQIKKVVLGLILLVSIFGLNIVSANALTSYELFSDVGSYIESLKYAGVFFEEGTMPDNGKVTEYIILSQNWEGFKQESDDSLYEKYLVPQDVYESSLKTFKYDDTWLESYRQNMGTSDMLFKDAKYVEIEGEYYYQISVLAYGVGYENNTKDYIKGYIDLGNDYYEIYFLTICENSTLSQKDQLGEDAVLVEIMYMNIMMKMNL